MKNKFEIIEYEIIPEMVHLVVVDYTDDEAPKVILCMEEESCRSMAGEILAHKSKGV